MTNRFEDDPTRINHTTQQVGKEFNKRLLQRAQSILTNLLNLLPSGYISAVQGPNYTNELKAVAVELSRLELAMEDVDMDRSFATTRSEFLYSIVGYLVFLNGRIPATQFDDVEFRRFLLSVIKIYFQGSIPTSIRDGVNLFTSENVRILENFLLLRNRAGGVDISDQFGFQIDIQSGEAFPPDVFALDANLRLILNIIRPAHTLFRIRYIFNDVYKPDPNIDGAGGIVDAMSWKMSQYYYEDFRSYWAGVQDRDRLGVKVNQSISNEDHSEDF